MPKIEGAGSSQRGVLEMQRQCVSWAASGPGPRLQGSGREEQLGVEGRGGEQGL